MAVVRMEFCTDQAQADELGKHGLITIRPGTDSFTFDVESTGVLETEEVVLQAIHILQGKLDAIGVRLFEREKFGTYTTSGRAGHDGRRSLGMCQYYYCLLCRSALSSFPAHALIVSAKCLSFIIVAIRILSCDFTRIGQNE